MTKVSKAGSPAILGEGKNGASTRIAWAGVAMLITLLLVTPRNSTAKRDPGTRSADLKMSVRVYNYAGVSRGTLLGAEAESSRIFRQAGVEVAWLDCTTSPSPEGESPACETPMGVIAVNLRVLPLAMAERFKSSREEMGFAVVSARAGSASDAWVFYQRVEDAAASEIASPPQILGCAMAHEIGHLLLGPDHHSREGIMCARWNQKSLEEASKGQMLFTRDQAQLIRTEVQTTTEMAQESVTGRPASQELLALKGR